MTNWLRHRTLPAYNGFISWLLHGAWPFVVFPSVIFIIALILKWSVIEFAMLSVMSAILIVTEMINYAIERICDLIELNYDGRIKLIKDVAAGAVAVSAFGLMMCFGFILFGHFFRGY